MFQEAIEKIVDEVLHEKVQEALQEINSRLPVADWKSNGKIEKIDGGYNLFFDNELIVFWDYGTGAYSKAYLSNKPDDVKEDAWNFKKEKDGFTKPHDVILSTVFKVLDEVKLEVDKRVEDWFKNVKL